MLAETGVSSPGVVGLRIEIEGLDAGLKLRAREADAPLPPCERCHDESESSDSTCRTLDRCAGEPGAEYSVAISRIFSISSDVKDGVRPRSTTRGVGTMLSLGGEPIMSLKLDFGVYTGTGMDGGRGRSSVRERGRDDVEGRGNGAGEKSSEPWVYAGFRVTRTLPPEVALGAFGKGFSTTDANPGDNFGESKKTAIFI